MKLYPFQVFISLPLWMKLSMYHSLLLFLCNFCSFFCDFRGALLTNRFLLLLIDIFWLFSKLYLTTEALVINFLICSNFLNCLRSVGTIAITAESSVNSLKKSFSLSKLTNYLSVSYENVVKYVFVLF